MPQSTVFLSSSSLNSSRVGARGLSIWPFIIALLLLIIFVFLWYGEKGNHETTVARAVAAEKDRDAKLAQIAVFTEHVNKEARVVGYTTKKIGEVTVSDLDVLEAELNPDNPGPVKALKDAAVVLTVKNLFTPRAGEEAPKEFKLPAFNDAFKQKIQEANAAFPKALPAMPTDPDDADAMAKWEADKKEYDDQMKKYQELLGQLTNLEGWKEYKAVIGAGTLFDPDRAEIVSWNYWAKPAVATLTVQEFLPIGAQVVKAIATSHKERVDAQLKDLAGLREEIAKLRLSIDNADTANLGLNQQLLAKQTELSEVTKKLQDEAATARGELEKLRVESTTSANLLAKEKEERKGETTVLRTQLSAEENARRAAKEKLDLRITRDEPDGRILAADNNLLVVYTNLGSADKVYAGLKFRVSYMARGAIRTTKGDILITKVLDRHYSQGRILSAGQPLSQGDLLSNPFFDASKPIHVFLAGDLKKYPKSIAASRLKSMGVILDDAVNAETDFIVVPESVTATPTPDAAAGAEGAPAPGAPSEYDRLQSLAHSFGADLVSEKLLESFLDY